MTTMKNKLLIMILFMLPLFACAQQDEEAVVSADSLISKLESDTSLVVLDVRTDAELTGPLGHIEGIVHIPIQELNQRLGELDQYKDREIAVVCRSGRRSGIATNILRDKGFNAKNVEGGMIEYNRQLEKRNAGQQNE